MANKSSKSPSGEDREQDSEYMRDQKPDAQDIKANAGEPVAKMAPKKQENQENHGYEEDQPHNPVRTATSSAQDQKNQPAGEPEKNGN